MRETGLPISAQLLGYAGLIPQAGCFAVALTSPPLAAAAAAVGWVYAGLIFSFLGGAWWGLALVDRRAPGWVLPVSVVPSLLALLTIVPTVLGARGMSLPLIVIGLGLLVSPLIDSRIAKFAALPEGWLRLRWHLSIGLGAMTILIGLWAG
jgi:hypothetical protein